MTYANEGDTVSVHYTGTLEDGSVFETTVGLAPIQFTIGGNEMLPGVERAVVGMKPGESATLRLAADEAFGPHREEMVIEIDRRRLEGHLAPEVGHLLQITWPDNESTLASVIRVTDSTVTVDANHPLAGKDLTLDIQLVDIVQRGR